MAQENDFQGFALSEAAVLRAAAVWNGSNVQQVGFPGNGQAVLSPDLNTALYALGLPGALLASIVCDFASEGLTFGESFSTAKATMLEGLKGLGISQIALLAGGGSTGEWQVPAGVNLVKLAILFGGGGGGGGTVNNGAGYAGGGAGLALGPLRVTDGGIIPYQIGAGGVGGTNGSGTGANGTTTTFGTMSATGGTGGANSPGGLASQSGPTPSGVGAGGLINLAGQRGYGPSLIGSAYLDAAGGGAPFTSNTAPAGSGQVGAHGTYPGGGGGGAASNSGGYIQGGEGADGWILLFY